MRRMRVEWDLKEHELDPSASLLDHHFKWNESGMRRMKVEWVFNEHKLDPSASPLDHHSKWNDSGMRRMRMEWDWSKGEAEGSSLRFLKYLKRKLDPSASPLDSQFDCLCSRMEWWNENIPRPFQSFWHHSSFQFCSISKQRNEAGMIEWWQDERCLRIKYFCPLLKIPSFPLILSFLHHFRMLKNDMEWK